MPAYLVAVRENVSDDEAFKAYAKTARGISQSYGGRVLAAFGEHCVLEGSDCDGVLIIEFPSIDIAKRYYNSAEYQRIIDQRFKSSNCSIVVITQSIETLSGQAS